MTSILNKFGIGGTAGKVQTSNSTSSIAANKKEPVSSSNSSDSSTKQSSDSEMDKPLPNSVQVKPSKVNLGAISPRLQPSISPVAESPKENTNNTLGDEASVTSLSGSLVGSHDRNGAENNPPSSTPPRTKAPPESPSPSPSPINKDGNKDRNKEDEPDHEDDSEEDIEPVDVLLQFIPYYGQGDTSNDSIVRATLSGLSVEDIDSKDEYGNTLLLLACQYRCEDLVRIMLNKGADPNATNSSGACCLHFACYRESASYAVAKVLLQNGASPDVAETTFGCTPLHYCAGTGDIKFCKLLLSYGAQIIAKDFYNYTCVDYAREAGMTDVATFLQQHYDKAVASGTTARKSVGFAANNTSSSSAKSTSGGGLTSGVSAGNSISSIGSGGTNMAVDMANWESHMDPDSGGKYYIHIKTGECLWENELQQRVDAYQRTLPPNSTTANGSNNKQPPKNAKSEARLAAEAVQMKLLIFLTKHDPSRIVEVDKLMEKYAGNETQMFADLRVQYKLEEPPGPNSSNVKSAAVSSAESKKLIDEAVEAERKKLLAQLDAAVEDERKIQRTEFKKQLEQLLEEERKRLKLETKKQIEAALEEEKKLRESELQNAVESAVLEERKVQRHEAQKLLDTALAEERQEQKNEARKLLESAIEEERSLLKSEAKRQIESAVEEERRVQKIDARRQIEAAVEEEYRLQKNEARKQVESAVEEERRILRIEARRQLEAALDEERKVQMAEAKRILDESIEEERKIHMKKIEHALQDEHKLFEKKLEAALEQEKVTQHRKMEAELEERNKIYNKLEADLVEREILIKKLEHDLAEKEKQHKQLLATMEEERAVHKKDMDALIQSINSGVAGQGSGDNDGLTAAINMKIESKLEELRVQLKKRYESAMEEERLAHNRTMESSLEEEKSFMTKRFETLLEEERHSHSKRLETAVAEERAMHVKRMEIAIEEVRMEQNKRLELAVEEERLANNKRLHSSLSEEKDSYNAKLEASLERERAAFNSKFEARLEEEKLIQAQKYETLIEEERTANNKKLKAALEDERAVQNKRLTAMLEEQKLASDQHLESVLQKERYALESTLQKSIEEKRNAFEKELQSAIEEERNILSKRAETLLDEERRLLKKQAEAALEAALDEERVRWTQKMEAALEEERQSQKQNVNSSLLTALEEERTSQIKHLEATLEEERRAQKKATELRLEEERKILRQHFEKQQEKELNQLNQRLEKKLDEEKIAFRQLVSEKEGTISQLMSEIEGLKRERGNVNDDVQTLRDEIDKAVQAAADAAKVADMELTAAKSENIELKSQMSSLREELNYSLDKLKSLELTLSNLTSGHEERIASEKAIAEERAQQQKEREAQFSQQFKQLESKAKNTEVRLKTELNQARQEWVKLEKQMKEEHEQVKKSKEGELEALRKELSERKVQFAMEMSAAQLEIEDVKKLMEENSIRAEEALKSLKMMQDEIAEAKIVQKYNGQLHKDLQREQLARKKLHNEMEDLKGKIRVYVRVRPFSKTEKERGCQESVIKDGKMTVMVKGLGGVPEAKKFYDFDAVFSGLPTDGNSQEDVFKDTKHLMMSVVDGYNVCIFAYGQTGAGKSFTMIGAADIGNCLNENGEFDSLAGITPRAVSELFRLLNERTAQVEYVVEVQMFQLYRDGLEDLLKDKPSNAEKRKKKKGDEDEDVKEKSPGLKITLAEHSPTGLVFIEGAEVLTATTPGDVMKIFAKGSSRRTTASTQMNAESSRSHLVCSLVVKLTNRRSGIQSIGKLTLVDLAGSERVDKSGAVGDVLKEAQSINKSLSALGDVISALTTGQQHIPYRNHPLTMLMSDSIGGNAKTLMFVNTSPADYNSAESNSSLAFASRCKDVTNQVVNAPGVQAAQVNALKKELAKLKKGGPPTDSKLPRPT